MTQFSIQWILSLNRLSQNWGPLQRGHFYFALRGHYHFAATVQLRALYNSEAHHPNHHHKFRILQTFSGREFFEEIIRDRLVILMEWA